jgi:serine-type D-Ala-D-Ala carboxypeptidase
MAKDTIVSFREKILEASPCCAYLVSKGKTVVDEYYGGFSLIDPYRIKISRDTLFDLASLTKPLATALIALKAYSCGQFDIFEPVRHRSRQFTPLDLMRHEAGFPDWIPLYKFKSADEARYELMNNTALNDTGDEALYSCPGYIFLGFLLEEKLGERLDSLFSKLLSKPLGIKEDEALFSPPPGLRGKTAGTELRGEYERKMAEQFGTAPPAIPECGLWGVVHDGNSRFFQGIAGNSGLFATLRGVFKLAQAFVPSTSFLPEEILQLAYNRGTAKAGEHRSAGFKLKGSPSWKTGEALKNGSIAHEGFTGTLVAITKEEEIMILLTNRIHPFHPQKSFSPERVSFLTEALNLLK